MLLDSSALIELFVRGEKSQRVIEVLAQGDSHISIVSLAEVINKLLQHGHAIAEAMPVIESSCDIVEVNKEISMIAGGLNFNRKKANRRWGMMDSFVLATAMVNDWKILTKDSDFADLENVEML